MSPKWGVYFLPQNATLWGKYVYNRRYGATPPRITRTVGVIMSKHIAHVGQAVSRPDSKRTPEARATAIERRAARAAKYAGVAR